MTDRKWHIYLLVVHVYNVIIVNKHSDISEQNLSSGVFCLTSELCALKC